MPEIKDFTKPRKRIQFKIDDDVFEAASAIPAEVLMDFAAQFAGMDPENAPVDKQLEAFRSVLSLVLLEESLDRFNARLRDRSNPIDIEQIEEIITWLFAEYGLRPTELSSGSSAGPSGPVSGMDSMANTADAVSISAASPSTDS